MYQSGEIKAKLQRILEYLAQQTYSEYMDDAKQRGLIFTHPTLGQWFNNIGAAREILKDAIASFDTPVLVIVVDLDVLERRAIAASIPDSDVIGLLPYQAGVSLGSTHFHIVNNSLYDVTTNAHVIPQGETICARGINTGDNDNSVQLLGVIPTCPGCLAKAKNQIAFHLQQQAQAGRLL